MSVKSSNCQLIINWQEKKRKVEEKQYEEKTNIVSMISHSHEILYPSIFQK